MNMKLHFEPTYTLRGSDDQYFTVTEAQLREIERQDVETDGFSGMLMLKTTYFRQHKVSEKCEISHDYGLVWWSCPGMLGEYDQETQDYIYYSIIYEPVKIV